MITGANVENASYGMTMCAERNAVFTAVAAGKRRFDAIAVYADAESVPPCGACRQVMSEFAPTLMVIFRRGGQPVVMTLEELLPSSSSCEPPLWVRRPGRAAQRRVSRRW